MGTHITSTIRNILQKKQISIESSHKNIKTIYKNYL